MNSSKLLIKRVDPQTLLQVSKKSIQRYTLRGPNPQKRKLKTLILRVVSKLKKRKFMKMETQLSQQPLRQIPKFMVMLRKRIKSLMLVLLLNRKLQLMLSKAKTKKSKRQLLISQCKVQTHQRRSRKSVAANPSLFIYNSNLIKRNKLRSRWSAAHLRCKKLKTKKRSSKELMSISSTPYSADYPFILKNSKTTLRKNSTLRSNRS